MSSLFGICGFIGSGKNTVADGLTSHISDCVQDSFAAPLKDCVANVFGMDRTMLEGDVSVSRVWREQEDPFWTSVFGRKMTPRLLLQEVGTNVFRQYCPNVWMESAKRRHDNRGGSTVMTDARFGNEMQWVRNNDGVCIWVYRPTGKDEFAQVDLEVRESRTLVNFYFDTKAHASETSFLTQGAQLLDIVIVNTGTLEALQKMVYHTSELLKTGFLQRLPMWRQHALYLRYEPETNVFQWRANYDEYLYYADSEHRVTQIDITATQ